MVNIAINGFGRIGRLFLRALSESKNAKNINVKIINDLADLESNIHLFKYDSIHGTYNKKIKKDKNSFDIGLGKIQIISETNPLKLPWKKNKINILFKYFVIISISSFIVATPIFMSVLLEDLHRESFTKLSFFSYFQDIFLNLKLT